MGGRPALRVRTAFHFFAVVLAFGYAVGLNAVRRWRTVFVDLTFDRRTATVLIGVADRAERAQTFKRASRVVAPGARSAGRRFAQVQHVAAKVRISRVAGLTVAHLRANPNRPDVEREIGIKIRSLATYLSMVLRRAQSVRPTRIVRQARYLAHVVLAYFVVRTILVLVTLDFVASDMRVPVIAGLAITNRLMVDRRTLGVPSTNHLFAHVDALGLHTNANYGNTYGSS